MVDYKLSRKQIKSITLRISRDGEVLVSAPYFCPKFLIDSFVQSKEDWINKKLRATENIQFDFDSKQREEFKHKLELTIQKWEIITGLHCKSFRIKNMKTRWGSCNPTTGNLNFNIQLFNKPEICIEYVVLHELVHLIVPNHSKLFYEKIEKYMPDYKVIRKMLNSEVR